MSKPVLSAGCGTLTPCGRLLGPNARVSTTDQNPELQHDALSAAGCSRIWTDYASGSKADRPELAALMSHLRAGDTVCVWRIDRLGRSLPHLIQTVAELGERGVQFRSLTEGFDTNTAGGEFLFHIMGALAQMERRMISTRTRAGLDAARARGRTGGRPSSITPAKRRQLTRMRNDGTPMTEIAEILGVSRATLYRHLTA